MKFEPSVLPSKQPRYVALQAYLQTLQVALRLQAYDLIVVDEEPNASGAVLSINPYPLRWHASVRVGSFFAEDRAEQKASAIHEVIHLMQADAWYYVMDEEDWARPLAPDQASAIRARLRLEMERHADWTARALVPLLPDPPEWPEPPA